jgi:hypothetical protein
MAVAMKASLSIAVAAACLAGGQTISEAVRRAAEFADAAQIRALRVVLAKRADEDGFVDAVFYRERRFRAPLLRLLSDPEVGNRARSLVAIIGAPGDIRRMVQLPRAKNPVFENRWAYDVACTLLEPGSNQEWEFLRTAASGGFDDRWVDAGAIQTLKLIASPKSRQVLEQAQAGNPSRADVIARALAYVDSNPAPMTAEDLPGLAERVALAVKIGKWEGNEKPRYNMEGDKALVDFSFRLPEDALTYTATFHRVGGVWMLRGIRETLQAFLPPVAVPVQRRPPAF